VLSAAIEAGKAARARSRNRCSRGRSGGSGIIGVKVFARARTHYARVRHFSFFAFTASPTRSNCDEHQPIRGEGFVHSPSHLAPPFVRHGKHIAMGSGELNFPTEIEPSPSTY